MTDARASHINAKQGTIKDQHTIKVGKLIKAIKCPSDGVVGRPAGRLVREGVLSSVLNGMHCSINREHSQQYVASMACVCYIACIQKWRVLMQPQAPPKAVLDRSLANKIGEIITFASTHVDILALFDV
jgi:hypothetical protein